MHNYNIKDLEIYGSKAVSVDRDGLVTTEDGSQYYWKADSPVEVHLRSMSGEWIEYKSND